MSTPNNASLVLIGRHGAGKTAVIESLLGKRLKVSTPAGDIGNTYKITTPGMALKVIETPGFFAAVDINTCKSKLVGTIRTSTPSTDAFGMVIQIGRFTTEQGKMIDLFQEIFGEGVFRFTIVIFTKLDELTYDDMTLDEFLQDSTPELQRFLTACGGRYIGFDNTGDWKTRAKYGERLVSMLKHLQTQNNNMVYTVAMLDEATGCQQKKEEEEKRKQEDEYRREKEEMKKRMREGMRREFDAELQRETVTTSQKYQAFGQDTKYKPIHGQGFQQKFLRRAKPTQVRTPPHGEQRPSERSSDNIYSNVKKTGNASYKTTQAERVPPKIKPKHRNIQAVLPKDKIVWVCQRCFELNDKQDLVCKKCHHTRGEKDRKEENVASQGEGLCPKCNDVIDVSTGMCQNCSMKNVSVARIEPFGVKSGPIEELRMVLLGKTGAGKSATANTILNEHVFPSRSSLKAVTDKCQYHRRERFGKIIQIVDTPGLFDTNLDKTMVEEEIKKCIAMSTPGPHAFLMVVSFTGRFTQEDTQVFKSLDDIFGKDMKRYMIIVFTNKDMIERDVGEHIEDCPDTLKEILEEAKGGYITFNNRGKDHEKDEDVKKLLDGIDIIVKSNEGGCFTSETFKEAEEVMQSRIMEELERKKEEMMKEVEEEVRKEMEEEFRKQREYFKRLQEESDNEKHYLERELASEKQKSEGLRKPMGRQETTMEKMKLQNMVQREVQTEAEQKTIIRRIQRSEGSERARMQQKLSTLGSQVKQIVAEKKQAEEAAIVKRYAANVDEELPKLRNMERQAIQRGEEETIGRYKKGMKKRGMSFLNFFRQILP